MPSLSMHGSQWVAVMVTLALSCPDVGVAGDESWEVRRGCCRTATGGTGDVLAEMTYDSRANFRCKQLCTATQGCVAAERRGRDRCEVLGDSKGAIVNAEVVGDGRNCGKCFVRGSAPPGPGATPEPTPPPVTPKPSPAPTPAPAPPATPGGSASTVNPTPAPTPAPTPTPSTVEPTLASSHAGPAEPRPEGKKYLPPTGHYSIADTSKASLARLLRLLGWVEVGGGFPAPPLPYACGCYSTYTTSKH